MGYGRGVRWTLVFLQFIFPIGMKKEMAFVVVCFVIIPCVALKSENAWGGHTSVSMDTVVRADGDVTLGEIVVRGDGNKIETQMRSAQSTVSVGDGYVCESIGGSLMQSLSKIAGVGARSVGSGASSPEIRGLGGNRILIAENGLKHEGQQWDDDHGLEIDQYAVEKAVVMKGPDALSYGSDAICGVVSIETNSVQQEGLTGMARVFARSNNGTLGVNGKAGYRRGRLWIKGNVTLTGYGDYKVPTDSIEYYSYYIKLKDKRLRNTAGREADGNIAFGAGGERWETRFSVSSVNAKSGFFANAHGIEVRLSKIDYDKSSRDIDLPRHTSRHTTIMNHMEVRIGNGTVTNDMGWQRNTQREESEPVSHGYMPKPTDFLERKFLKHTFQDKANVRLMMGQHVVRIGAAIETQVNRRGGWGFIIPDFKQTSVGCYCSDRLIVSDEIIVSYGVRYDYGKINIESYNDWYKTPTADGDSAFKERSKGFQKAFESVTWSVGMSHNMGLWLYKVNFGKGFRMPIAKELGADGVNYNIFRYEQGNDGLGAEESYQIDAGIYGEWRAASFAVTPFANYFPNYIYLSPTSRYAEGLQLYEYTESRVVRLGLEASGTWHIMRNLDMNVDFEYLRARQKSGAKKGYTLPFSPPIRMRGELRYTYGGEGRFVSAEVVCVGPQDEIVPPEETTPGHRELNASLGWDKSLGKGTLRITMRGDNLLNKRYYDHTSFYRLIDVPEPGRNGSIMMTYIF